ncbi:hypothetical protein SAMN04489844_0275 [Nocardioides exalbidus]|uniref:Uncharacterized protein n=1 Tax=Nocardioides exalbidus TaxID=402596 RepID=A0A1H4JT18_9ACTN|nr:hypothetical protein [Nocardioides exalbidus]SEB49146.1 hypothetical protein SAMN04489844_0275 [Nocardioides exalbidus]
MPDIDQLDPALDRAFDALTRDLARSPGPGAPAAMATVRKRRRTRVGAVALATLVVVGGGLTVPRMMSANVDGVAANGAAQPLDAAALETATAGWLSGWEAWSPNSPKGGGSYTMPECLSDDTLTEKQPQVGWGISQFVGSEFAMTTATFGQYPDVATAEAAQSEAYATCRGATTATVDGVEVWHYAEAPSEPRTAMTDVWTAQIGTERLTLEIAGRAGVAPGAVADRVAEAVVAGLRSGESQEQSDGDPNAVDPDAKPQLPPVMDSDLTRALAGWKATSRATASTIPNAPCLSAQVDSGSVSASGSGTPRGVSWQIGGFDDETTGPANIERMLDQIRSCTDPRMSLTTVAAGVTLVTYDVGGQAGHGALWLHAVGDRAMVTGVGGAADAMPAGVGDDVARVMDDWLRIPWE